MSAIAFVELSPSGQTGTEEMLYKRGNDDYLLVREGYVHDQMLPLDREQALRWMDMRRLVGEKQSL